MASWEIIILHTSESKRLKLVQLDILWLCPFCKRFKRFKQLIFYQFHIYCLY